MTSVASLIQAVHEAGGRLHPIGSDRLKVRAPRPLAEGLISELRAHKPAVLAFLAGQRTAAPPASAPPAAWIAGVARLIGADPLPGYTKDRWRVLVRDAEHLGRSGSGARLVNGGSVRLSPLGAGGAVRRGRAGRDAQRRPRGRNDGRCRHDREFSRHPAPAFPQTDGAGA